MNLITFFQNIRPFAGKWIYLTLFALVLSAFLDGAAIISIVPILLEYSNGGLISGSWFLTFLTENINAIAINLTGKLDISSIMLVLLIIVSLKGLMVFSVNLLIAKMRAQVQLSLRESIIEAFGEANLFENNLFGAGKFSNILVDQINRSISAFYAFVQTISFIN